LAIVQFLREMILDSIPEAKEKLTYNVPYYSGKKRICFVWPGAVFWGSKRTYEGVRLGFVHGHLMHDDIDLTWSRRAGRAFIIKLLPALTQVDKDLLSAYLQGCGDDPGMSSGDFNTEG
jgi:hypothetical protein